jgi:Family of unknown function (DUF6492)
LTPSVGTAEDRGSMPFSLDHSLRKVGWVSGKPMSFNLARAVEISYLRLAPERFDRHSGLPLDILIPATDTDADVLPVTIEGARRNLAHPIGKIWVVTTPGSKAARVADDMGCHVVDENHVLPMERKDISYRHNEFDRSGWLFQQLLKLSADLITSHDHVLVLDADTVLVRPQTFTSGRRIVLFHSSEYHEPYFRAYRALVGRAPSSRVSCITHHLLMNRASLRGLRALIEGRWSVAWWEAILNVCEYSSLSGFAESETYGNYELAFGRHVARRWWKNYGLPRTQLADLDLLQGRFGKQFRTVSFHHYL